MKKSALLRSVAGEVGVPYGTVKLVVDTTLEKIVERLQVADRVVLSGFGTFALRPYKARTWVNPQTNRPVDIPAALRPGFITSAALKRRLGDPAATDGEDHTGTRRPRAAHARSNGAGAAAPSRKRRARSTMP